jgi:hypothetical protein
MQRQTGSRVKPPLPGTPPIAPAADADADGKDDKTEPAAPCQIVPRPQD